MESNGKGIFYGVIGVATLIVAIVGATFAYFSASADNAGTVAGEAATAGLNLKVEPVSTDATGPMVPQSEAGLNSAVAAEKQCVDGNNNTVCKVYRITVENTGSSATVVTGTLVFTAATFTNLKWADLTDAKGTFSDARPIAAATGDGSDTDNSILVKELTLQAADASEWTGADSSVYYIVVYINETGSSQNDTDKGQFTGTVAFNSAAGTGVTSTFQA